MQSFIQTIPSLITSEDNSLFEGYNLGSDLISSGYLQNDYSTYNNMYIGQRAEVLSMSDALSMSYADIFDGESTFGKLTEIQKPMTIADFIEKVKTTAKDVAIGMQLADYLIKVAHTLHFDMASTDIATLVWGAQITNKLGENDPEREKYLNDIFYSTIKSPAYKGQTPLEAKTKILEKFENDVNRDLAQSYLGIQFMTNPEVAANPDTWFNYKKFEEISEFEDVKIENRKELFEALSTENVSSYKAAIDYVKDTYLSSEDKTNPAYCENELVKDYKATLIVSELANKVVGEDFDKDNEIGFNLCSKVANIPALLTKQNPIMGMSSTINKYDREAGKIAKIIGGTKKVKIVNRKAYITKQFSMLEKLIEKAYKSCIKKPAKAKKNPSFVGETSKEELRILKLKRIFQMIRKRKGADLEIITEEQFKKILGTSEYENTSVDLKEIINKLYSLVAADPVLKADPETAHYRIKTAAYIMEDIASRGNEDTDLEFIFKAHKLTPAQKVKYEIDSQYYNTDGTTNEEYRELYNATFGIKEDEIDEPVLY
ncbi:MAG: hypothetical protein J6K97_01545 [Clostridia bacterium]|nr:hypothetical protein [Clostridia bacterium]